MRILLPLLLLAPLSAVAQDATAEPVKVSKKVAKALEGKWVEQGGVVFEIHRAKKSLWVDDIVDTDGERFVVQQNAWKDGQFVWTYRVPSTDYVVTNTVTSYTADTITTSWVNAEASGDDSATRMK